MLTIWQKLNLSSLLLLERVFRKGYLFTMPHFGIRVIIKNNRSQDCPKRTKFCLGGLPSGLRDGVIGGIFSCDRVIRHIFCVMA